MILLYWWMHWFWITSKINCENLATTTTNNEVYFKLKTTGIGIVSNPSATSSPSINTTITHNDTMNHTNLFDKIKPNTTMYSKEIAVINPNITETNLMENSTYTSVSNNFTYLDEDNETNETLLVDLEQVDGVEDENLSAAGITGITLGCVVIVGILCGISYFIYRNRGFNRPQVLNDRCSNPDSSGYIDDASVRDNSEEMYSLDNDSFLNSLEAMTIQNYWTDTVKHTKL